MERRSKSKKKKEETTGRGMLIYQWVSIQKKALDYTDPLTQG